jgi:hypothetical protein
MRVFGRVAPLDAHVSHHRCDTRLQYGLHQPARAGTQQWGLRYAG